MTSSNGNIFRVTGLKCGEFIGPGEFPTQRPVTRSFDVFSLICVRINGWVNNGEAGDLRRYLAYCGVIVMLSVNLSMSPPLCHCLCVCLCLGQSFSVSLSLSLCLSPCLSLWLCISPQSNPCFHQCTVCNIGILKCTITGFSNEFHFLNRNCLFRLKFHWNLFPKVQITIIQHWFRWWLGAAKPLSEPMMALFNDVYTRHSTSMS